MIVSNVRSINNYFFCRNSPKKEQASGRKIEGGCDSFQNFQDSVNDAWDCGDDEFSVISGIYNVF